MENDKQINKFYEDFIKSNLPKTKKEWVGYIMIILIVVVIGLWGVNSYLGIQYKATLIQNPCQLCEDFQRQMRANQYAPGGLDISKLKINLSD